MFLFRVCHAFLSIHCSLVVTCKERANLLALLYVMFSCVFVTFLCGVVVQVWCLIVSIPDLFLLTYHVNSKNITIEITNPLVYFEFLNLCGLHVAWRS